jgi:transketolase
MRQTCLNSIFELAKINNKVIFIGSDLGFGVLNDFKKKFPKRFFMEGVSEQFIIGMAAGLAKEGFIPYVNTIATFLTRRCFDQIVVDMCLHNLPVRLIANGGGLVYAPLGPTHLALEDISILRSLPNMTILSPCDAIEMKNLVMQTTKIKTPIYIRIARGGDKIISKSKSKIGDPVIFKEGKDIAFITTGVMAQVALEASNRLEKQGFNAKVIHLHTLKPISEHLLINNLKNISKIITVEEHFSIGGLGSIILEFLNRNKLSKKIEVKILGIPDRFPDKYGEQIDLFDYYKLNSKSLVNEVLCYK